MSSQDQVSVEAAAALFASQNESEAELFDSYFNQKESENDIGNSNSNEPFRESSGAEAASLFDAGADGSVDLFTHDASLDVFPPNGSVEKQIDTTSLFESEMGTDLSYEQETFSPSDYHNPESQPASVGYKNQPQTYENSSYEANNAHSMNYYPTSPTNQWTTYATSNDATYGANYSSQIPSSSQYSHLPQMNYNAPTTANQGYTPSAPHPSATSNSQYSYSSGFMSFDPYNSTEPAKPTIPTPTVTAYRPKTLNAYDPPVPTKLRMKPRYAPPSSSINYTSFYNGQTSGTQIHNAPPPQSSVTYERHQENHAFSSELNPPQTELVYGDTTQQISQLNQAQMTTPLNMDTRVGADNNDFGKPANPAHQDFSEYLDPGIGTALTSSVLTEPNIHSALSGYAAHTEQRDSTTFFQRSYDPYRPQVQSLDTKINAPPRRSSFHNPQSKGDQAINTTNPATVDHPASKANFLPISTAVTHTPYAPSPTLIGANDPLGRASIRAPVISFGFGGKLVSCFHRAQDAGGFDVSLTAHQTTFVTIRPVTEAIPVSALESNGSSFPGPLFSDPGASSLARTVGVGMTSQMKSKKTTLLKWLDERAIELANGIPYTASGPDRYKAEGRLVLLTLLKVMVENDGQLSGSPSIEWAVRTALVPSLRNEEVPAGDEALLDSSLYTPYLSMTASTEQSMAVQYVKNSSLDRIKEFLIRGDKVKAYQFAMDEKLWPHAMLIANSVDAQSFKEVVREFIHSELGVKNVLGSNPEQAPQANGKESLRVAYSLFSGQGASSIQELFPSKSLSSNNMTSPVAQFSPVTPSFQKPLFSTGVVGESLAQWQETVSMMVFTQAPGDSAALTSLGDCLAANHWVEAAHVCYLLSPRTSSFGGISIPSVRVVLVGSESPVTLPNFHKNLDVTLLSEVVEFALSLSTTKGQEPFSGLPHLQAYKLLRAYHLAEMGYVDAANRYCEAIGNTIRASGRGSQFYTPTFISGLKDLSDRLTAVPQSDKPGSWISRTMAKPSLDTIGSWLEGRFSKIIVGEGEDNVPSPSRESQAKATYAYGPFSHYSSISSAAPSAPASRSATPYAVTNAVLPGSMMAQNPIDRAASAIDYARLDRRRTSPIQRVASANAVGSSVKPLKEDSISQYRGSFNTATVSEDSVTDGPVQESTWWGSRTINSSDPTPTVAAFNEAPPEEPQGNFISLMDGVPSGFTSGSPKEPASIRSETFADEEEGDLGFGNSSFKKGRSREHAVQKKEEDTKEEPKEETKVGSEKPMAKPELVQQSSSWFGSLLSWRRGSSQSPAPIVANLGEEKSFYYDKELKRWVNKNAPDTAAASTPPPPPPPRAQTASPSVALSNASPIEQQGAPSSSPLPPRASSAIEPARKPPRIRSNLVPREDTPIPSSAPPVANSFDPPGLENGFPPTNRPKSSASKRNVRSRYVDVFQQNA